MTVTYLITGTNKGIGFALVQNISKKNNVKIIATVRRPSDADELQKLALETKNIEIVELHPGSEESIDKFAKVLETVAADGIDYFIGNAGYAKAGHFNEIPYEVYMDIYRTNILGNIFVVKAALPYLRKKPTKKIILVSSMTGSITSFTPFPTAAYGSSKAALNYIAQSMKLTLGPEGFTVIPVHPGLVSTQTAVTALKGLPKEIADTLEWTTPEDSAAGLVKIAETSTPSDSGKFLQYDGTELPF